MFEDIKAKLNENDLTFAWLMARLAEEGIIVDKVSMSKWTHGKQLGKKAELVRDTSIVIIEKYEKAMKEQ